MVLESVLVSVVGTSSSSARAVGSIPGGRAKSPHSSRSKKQNRKQKQYCNKFNKDFKKQSTSKKILKKLFLIKNKNIWIQQGFLPLITQFWESRYSQAQIHSHLHLCLITWFSRSWIVHHCNPGGNWWHCSINKLRVKHNSLQRSSFSIKFVIEFILGFYKFFYFIFLNW